MRTLIYLADLAHTQTVPDTALTVPLSIGYVAAYARKHLGRSVEIRLFKHPEHLLHAVSGAAPDVVGFANYGWNTNLTKTIGKYLRGRLPTSLFVAGGPNLDAEAARRLAYLREHDYLDFLIVDGGEQPFAELVSWWRDTERDLDRLPKNLLYIDETGELHASPERDLSKLIEGITSPYLEGELDKFLERGMVPMLETNRGCPFRCTFCAWGMASKDLVRRFDLDVALAEIDYIGKRSKAKNWIICDANFGILPRDVEIARAIRRVKDTTGTPEKCHMWLSKNTSMRNIEIAGIMGDMVVPVMAVQSMDEAVLKHIKRDNIKLSTYRQYQKLFHRIGHRTYSDLIVPLPGETLDSHLAALRQLLDADVDIIMNHNMRLLAGAETNSSESRRRFEFTTRYRLIHGDAGEYKTPSGDVLRAFEYEESLRSTSSMTEAEMFYLRKLHFIIDFCWNVEVYKPLLRVLRTRSVGPLEVMRDLLSPEVAEKFPRLGEFWREFDRASQEEWFDTPAHIEAFFQQEKNWRRLVGLEYEKLNLKFGLLALRSFKDDFDGAVSYLVGQLVGKDYGLDAVCRYTFALFPPLDCRDEEKFISMPVDYERIFAIDKPDCTEDGADIRVRLSPALNRASILSYINGEGSGTFTLSKVMNTGRISLRDLGYRRCDVPAEAALT